MVHKKEKPLPWKQYITGKTGRWKILFLLFFWFEWICEHISFCLGKCAFIEVLEYLGKLSLLGALLAFIYDIPKRRHAAEDARKAKNYQAWQMINSAAGLSGDGGRKLALEDLNSDNVPLDWLNLGNAVLHDIKLNCASMKGGNLSRTDLKFAVIRFSDFYKGSFWKAHSLASTYQGDSFVIVDAREAVFGFCGMSF